MVDYKVLNFVYNGLFGHKTGGYADYTAQFKEWTDDPGIALCVCSDGVERRIPTFALENFDFIAHQEPVYGQEKSCILGFHVIAKTTNLWAHVKDHGYLPFCHFFQPPFCP